MILQFEQRQWNYWGLIAVPCLYVLAVTGPELLFGRGVLSSAEGDLLAQFYAQREFYRDALLRGTLPLWNPHIYLGMPAVGNITMAFFYPFHLLALFLPLSLAINLFLLIHLAGGGVAMSFWLWRRRLSLVASVAGGVLYIGCGAHFPHLLAGHIPHLTVLAWAPCWLLCIDEIIEGNRRWSVLLGGGALAMMLLGGYPQYLAYLLYATVFYLCWRWRSAVRRRDMLLALGGVCFGGIALSAVQLLATWHGMAGSTRSGGLDPAYAGTFSLPPENLLTVVAPFVWGTPQNYYGRVLLWEAELFMGITALFFLAYALLARREAFDRRMLLLAAIFMVFALGRYLPSFSAQLWLFPGFSLFRCHSKWALPASIFVIVVAARGLDSYLRSPTPFKRLSHGLLVAAGTLAVGGAWCWYGAAQSSPPGWWQSFGQWMLEMGEFSPHGVQIEPTGEIILRQTALSFLLAAATCLLLAFVHWHVQRRRDHAWLFVLILVLELFTFDQHFVTSFSPAAAELPQIAAVLQHDPGDYRITTVGFPNAAMSLGANDIWGYDPFVPRNYLRFMARTLGLPDTISGEGILLNQWHPRYSLLRLKYSFDAESGVLEQHPAPFPRAFVVHDYQVMTAHSNEIVDAVTAESFAADRQVILEEDPKVPRVVEALPGMVAVRQLSTDEAELDVTVTNPGLIVVTDQYHPGWVAEALPGSAQSDYRILRANGFLRAIPVSAGTHRIRMRYVIPGFPIAAALSCTAFGLWGWGLFWLRREGGDKCEHELRERRIDDLETEN